MVYAITKMPTWRKLRGNLWIAGGKNVENKERRKRTVTWRIFGREISRGDMYTLKLTNYFFSFDFRHLESCWNQLWTCLQLTEFLCLFCQDKKEAITEGRPTPVLQDASKPKQKGRGRPSKSEVAELEDLQRRTFPLEGEDEIPLCDVFSSMQRCHMFSLKKDPKSQCEYFWKVICGCPWFFIKRSEFPVFFGFQKN